jgi:hypothetical protein
LKQAEKSCRATTRGRLFRSTSATKNQVFQDQAKTPPSTTIVAPVVKELAEDAR